MELYTSLEAVLLSPSPAQKIEMFRDLYRAYRNGEVTRNAASVSLIFKDPSYHSFCAIADPKEVPRRTNLGTARGQILLLHAIAHIEYSAIDLALDAVYRFRDCGEGFESDWLEVADDEVRHFEMIEGLLHELGSHYGEVPVHDALFEASMRTLDLVERMAVVPRYLEANGLDATPQILRKLQAHAADPMIQKIVAALHIILDEEIDHVRKGDHWFAYACERSGVEPSVYFEIIERHYPQSFPRRVAVNCEARRLAGFGSDELKKISVTKCLQ